MYYAQNYHYIPERWKHNPELRNIKGQTIAMIYAKNKHIPPKEWIH